MRCRKAAHQEIHTRAVLSVIECSAPGHIKQSPSVLDTLFAAYLSWAHLRAQPSWSEASKNYICTVLDMSRMQPYCPERNKKYRPGPGQAKQSSAVVDAKRAASLSWAPDVQRVDHGLVSHTQHSCPGHIAHSRTVLDRTEHKVQHKRNAWNVPCVSGTAELC